MKLARAGFFYVLCGWVGLLYVCGIMQAYGDKFDEVQLLFIKETLEQHGVYVSELLAQSLKDKKMVKSGALRDEFAGRNAFKVSNGPGSPKLEFTFSSYGRFAEIGYFKSKNTKNFMVGSQNSLFLSAKSKKKKDTRFYSKFVWGSLNRLIGILMYEYDDATIARLKEQLTIASTPLGDR